MCHWLTWHWPTGFVTGWQKYWCQTSKSLQASIPATKQETLSARDDVNTAFSKSNAFLYNVLCIGRYFRRALNFDPLANTTAGLTSVHVKCWQKEKTIIWKTGRNLIISVGLKQNIFTTEDVGLESLYFRQITAEIIFSWHAVVWRDTSGANWKINWPDSARGMTTAALPQCLFN